MKAFCSALSSKVCESKYCLQSCHYYVVQMIPSISLKTIAVVELCLLEIRDLICTTLAELEVSLISKVRVVIEAIFWFFYQLLSTSQ